MTADTRGWFDGTRYWISCPEHGQQAAEHVAPGLVRCLASDGAESFSEPMGCERIGAIEARSGDGGFGGAADWRGDDVKGDGCGEEREQAGHVDGD